MRLVRKAWQVGRSSGDKSRSLLLSESTPEESGCLIPLPIIGHGRAFDRTLLGIVALAQLPGC